MTTVREAVLAVLCLSVCFGTAVGCGDKSTTAHQHDADVDAAVDEEAAVGDPTGTTCPIDNKLTYENFGKGFMESYCTRCHASTVKGDDRKGAPDDHDFDSLIGILSAHEHIDEVAGAGPDAVNETMPPDGARPSEAERRKLAQWLICEFESYGDDAGAQH